MVNWTEEYIDILTKKYYFNGVKIPELNKAGFTEPAIQSKARRLVLHHKSYKFPPKKRKKELDLLTDHIIIDYINGMTMNKLSQKYDCSICAIRKRLKDNNIEIRSRRDGIIKGRDFHKTVALNDYVRQVLDGLMISDGNYRSWRNLGDTASFSLEQKKGSEELVIAVKDCFEKNNIEYSITNRSRTYKEKEYSMIYVQTKAYQEFGDQWKRWYLREICFCHYCNIAFHEESVDRKNWKKSRNCPICMNGQLLKKIVPKDIKLTPITLAYWLMGDGSLAESHYKKYDRTYYTIILCTDGFLKKDVLFLIDLFNETYGYHFKLSKEGNRFRLRLNIHDELRDFLLKTSFYKIPCFDYKWKALNDSSHQVDRKYWNKRRDDLVRKWYPSKGSNIKELRDEDFSRGAITQRAGKLGVKYTG
ncbi:MAG: hypothetical protein KAV40_00685 [Thermoplasmatales archaeon]|nr:hypothetical protein [Thermoplasmatales archaeon]